MFPAGSSLYRQNPLKLTHFFIMSSQELISTSKGRSQIMDIFRIILCIGVVVYHYTPERCSTGPLMVNGFLVMSGFLVGFSIFSTKGLNVHYFFNSKCRRLLPILRS